MDFFNKTKRILTEPEKFFKSVKKDKEILKPWKYYVVVLIIYLFGTAVASIPAILLHMSKESEGFFGFPAGIMGVFIMLLIFVIIFVFSLGFVFLGSAVQHLFFLIVGAKKKFIETFKLVCYCTAPLIFLPVFTLFEIIPLFGQIFSMLASLAITVFILYLEVIAAKTLHEISTLRVVMGVIVIPVAFMLIVALLIAFFVIALFSVSFAQLGFT